MAEQPSLRVKRLFPDARLPQRSTGGASGYDLFAYIPGDTKTIPLEQRPGLIGTGIAIEVPPGYDAQIRPRSGLSARGAIVVLGTIDSDYRGELLVTMYKVSPDINCEVRHGDRIAQLVIAKLAELPLAEATELSPTERGASGHGSTGT